MYLVISCSLHATSRSRLLALEMLQRLEGDGRAVQLVDLREWGLPLCDGEGCYADPRVQRLRGLIDAAAGIVIATPIYNYDVSAAAKNVVELTGKAWSHKVVGLVCAAGGPVSYMAAMGLIGSLMLDFRTFVLPNFVFATGKSFDATDRVIDEKVEERLNRLARTLVRVTEALRPPAP